MACLVVVDSKQAALAFWSCHFSLVEDPGAEELLLHTAVAFSEFQPSAIS